MRPILLLLVALLATAIAVPALRAQGEGDPTTRQQLAESRFRELVQSMERLHAYLTKVGNDDEVKVVRAGMTLAHERRIQESMATVQLLLQHERWDDAIEKMQDVRRDLVQLLELLQNRNTDLQKVLEKIAALQAMRDEVDRLAKEQAAEKEASAETEELLEQLEALKQARAAAEQLLAEQRQLRRATNDLGLQASPGDVQPMAQKEGDLRERTEELAKKLEEAEQKAAQLDGEPEAGKPAEGQPKEGQPSAEGRDASSSAAKAAAKSMQQAGDKLGQNRPEPSLPDQDKAIDQLQRTLQEIDRLAEQTRRELDKLPFDLQAQKQLETQQRTDALARKMEQQEQGSENGDGEPVPGRKSVQQAVPKQKAAAGTLKEHKPAKQDQQDAKEDLEKARDELDEAINQLRQQLQDEVLRALEERFLAMLKQQQELSLQTKTLDQTRGHALTADGGLPAALRERIQAVASGEQDLEVEAGDALKLLQEEGTTAVFPDIVEVLKEQLHEVARRCRGDETGPPVQQRQADVEDTLGLLINALRRTIEDREGGQPGQCSGQPPLVPISAELKMIKFLQERVNARTKDYDEGIPAALRDTDAARQEAQELAEKQVRVRDLTRKLASKLNQENHAEDGR